MDDLKALRSKASKASPTFVSWTRWSRDTTCQLNVLPEGFFLSGCPYIDKRTWPPVTPEEVTSCKSNLRFYTMKPGSFQWQLAMSRALAKWREQKLIGIISCPPPRSSSGRHSTSGSTCRPQHRKIRGKHLPTTLTQNDLFVGRIA